MMNQRVAISERMPLINSKKSGNNFTRHAFLFMTLTALILFVLDIILGSVNIDIREVIKVFTGSSDSEIATVILKFRIPKALTAVLVGMALSVSGLQMQTVFRNPMAGPYVLGISSGASLGVAIVILGFSKHLSSEFIKFSGNWLLAASAWLGAAIVLVIILLVSLRIKDILAVLIIGIMLSGGISSVVSIMQYFSTETMLKSYVIWTMGSLGNLTSQQLQVMAITVAAGLFLSILSVKMLNALLLGDTYASSLGLNIQKARLIIFTGTSLLAGSITAFCGPIGFIGIAVPHLARIILKTSDHKLLIPFVILTGAGLMLLCDIVSQLPGSDRVIPLNAVTSLAGIPVVIWVVLRTRKYQTNV